jgi:hypothetical protein
MTWDDREGEGDALGAVFLRAIGGPEESGGESEDCSEGGGEVEGAARAVDGGRKVADGVVDSR